MPCDIPPDAARGMRPRGLIISPGTTFFVSGMYRDNEGHFGAIIEHCDAIP
jgi:hypothetical protein